MARGESAGRRWLVAGEWVAAHVAAVAIGLILMIVGLALGVTMVLLPVGIVVGLVGTLVFIWGLLVRADTDS